MKVGDPGDTLMSDSSFSNRNYLTWVKQCHYILSATKGPDSHSATDIFAQRRQIRYHTGRELEASRGQSRSHDFIKDEECARRLSFRAEHLEKFERGGETAA